MLNDRLKTALIEDLRELNIPRISDYARRNQKVIHLLYGQKIIDDSSIEEALKEAVFRQARRYYEAMTRRGNILGVYPDHVASQESIAYAIEERELSKREIKRIPFDHGETAETFCQHYRKENLLSKLRIELLNPKPIPKYF